HLVADDANDLLLGRQAFQHFLVDGAIAHAIDERLHDLEVDVRLEQRHPDFAECQLDGLFREASLSANAAEYVLQTIGKGLEHGRTDALSSSRANPYCRGIAEAGQEPPVPRFIPAACANQRTL